MTQVNSLSELTPDQANFIDGEYSTEGALTLRQSHTAIVGDVQRCEYPVDAEFGNARGGVLGSDHYFVGWGTYAFESGPSYFAQINQPYIEIHFQLRGAVHTRQNAFVPAYKRRPGSTNLVFMPPGSSPFAIDMGSEGTLFRVQLAPGYFAGLAERYPHLFGPFLEKMLQQKGFFLSREPLQITPAMWGIIERVRQRGAGTGAGSLFLESKILELLALQLQQLDQPVRHNDVALSAADTDRIHEAHDILLDDVADPPTLSELARRIGTNEYKLKRGFKALFGNSPYAYLLDYKLESVRAYLLDTDWTIAEIAYRVGYSHPAHLTNAFRKKYGMPPSELRAH